MIIERKIHSIWYSYKARSGIFRSVNRVGLFKISLALLLSHVLLQGSRYALNPNAATNYLDFNGIQCHAEIMRGLVC